MNVLHLFLPSLHPPPSTLSRSALPLPETPLSPAEWVEVRSHEGMQSACWSSEGQDHGWYQLAACLDVRMRVGGILLAWSLARIL